MSKNKISPLEQAALDMLQIENAAKKNAKDMLFAELRPDINKAIQESIDMEDDEEEEMEEPKDNDIEIGEPSDDKEDKELKDDLEDSEEDLEDDDMEDTEDELTDDDMEFDDELDLTDSDDDDVLSIFKKIKDDTDIEVIKDKDGITIKKDGDEYIVKLNEDMDMDGMEEEMNDDKYSFIDEDMEEDEVIYEINMDGEEDKKEPEMSKPMDEVARTHADGRKQIRKPEGFFKYAADRVRYAQKESMNETKKHDTNKVLLKEVEEKTKKLLTENKELKKQNQEYKSGLRQLREAIDSMSVFNYRLQSVNKLFKVYPTTLDEKKIIAERFDAVSTVKEAKTLYKTISTELKTGKSIINETVESLIKKSGSTSTGKPLNEEVQSSTHETKALNRMKELMGL
jgi:hypothetical protein